MAEWKIARRRGVCSACERPFEDGERHVCTLRVAEGGLERAEFCGAWWNARPEAARGEACAAACRARAELQAGSGGPAGPAGDDLFWWFTRHSAAGRRTVRLDLESLERLFVELEGRAETAVRELRYVLCLILMRKRRLKVERVERGAEGESFLVRRPRREERYRVHVFDFTPERTAEVRTQLQAIFDGAEGLDELEGLGEAGDGPVPDGGAEGPSGGAPADDPVAAGEP